MMFRTKEPKAESRCHEDHGRSRQRPEQGLPPLSGDRRDLRWVPRIHRCHEPIAPARHGLDKPWIFGCVPQRLAQSLNGGIQSMLEVYEGAFWPEFLMELFACDHLARLFQQHDQDLKGLVLQLDLQAVLA